MTGLEWQGLTVLLGVGLLIGAALVAVGVCLGFWVTERSRGVARPILGEPEAAKIEQEETD